jgi:hypothetical protein
VRTSIMKTVDERPQRLSCCEVAIPYCFQTGSHD